MVLDRKNWMPRIIEGVVIIGSILLAFAIDAWWQDRQKMSMERQIILAVISEIESNTVMANDAIESHQVAIDRIKFFLSADEQQLAEKTPEEIYETIEYFPYSLDFVANLSAANMLIQSPPLNENGILTRRAVGEYIRTTRELASISIDEERRSILRLMSGLIAERQDLDFNNSEYIYTQSLISRLGTQTLWQLRTNPEVIKRLIDKSHVQIVLHSRLQRLVKDMEKLKVELNALTDTV